VTSEGALVQALADLCAERSVSLVVIGLPLSADGSEGPGCVRARRIAEALGASGMTVALHDEQWSSRDAEDILRETGKSRTRSKDGRMSRGTVTGKRMSRGTVTGKRMSRGTVTGKRMSRGTVTGKRMSLKMPRGTATGIDAIAASLILSEYLREISRP
jgi:RNase H-fold protein (predicted Holliday junction resolvase)